MNARTLHKISYGVYIVTSISGDEINGQIANALFQVTSKPATIAVSINKQNLTHEYIQASGVLAISILSEGAPMTFIGKFGFKSGRDIDKFDDVKYRLGNNRAPIILEHTTGYLEAKVINQIDSGTHTIFIGEVSDAEILGDENVMTYEYYHKIKGGVSPKNAPTYSEVSDKVKGGEKMDKYECTVCGYVYDPEKGDPDSGVSAGTEFESLPDDWVCPVCGAGKEAFEKVA